MIFPVMTNLSKYANRNRVKRMTAYLNRVVKFLDQIYFPDYYEEVKTRMHKSDHE